MSWILIGAASFLSAVLGALGMGGGGILVLYLTAHAGVPQLQAQGINLVFFVPVAVVALCIHQKNRLIHWGIALPCIFLGAIGVYFGVKLAMLLEQKLLGKLFGGFLMLIGLRELFAKSKSPPPRVDKNEK